MEGDLLKMKYSLTKDIEATLLLQDKYEVPECTTKHHFSPGVYVREITMPTGSIILGHRHTTTHLNMISKGSCYLIDEDNMNNKILIEAPYTFESKAGDRKLLYIIEECVWSTIHVTDETDLDKIESQVIEKSTVYKELEGEN